jgi:hypothetical protein
MLGRPDDICRSFIVRLGQTRIVPHLQVVVDCDDGEGPGRRQLLAMYELRRHMERGEDAGAPV